MKINIIIPSTVLGGGLRVAFTYANLLVKQGHDVIAYIPAIYKWRDVPKWSIKTSIANSFIRRNKVDWFDVKFPIKVIPMIKNMFVRDADITIATAWFTARNVFELSNKKGKKVYFIQDYEIWNQKKEVVDSTYKLDMKRIVITKSLQNTLKKECGVDSEVVYNGHSSDEYLHTEKKLNNPKTIIMLGNFANYKGGQLGLDVLLALNKKYGIRIIIFSAQQRNDLPECIEYYHKPNRKLLISLYQQSDICLFPSLKEAWGLSAIEAMANKVAVVGFNTGCLAEIGNNYENAIIVENGNVEALQSAVEELINNDNLLKKIQNNGYSTVCGLTWESAGAKFERALMS